MKNSCSLCISSPVLDFQSRGFYIHGPVRVLCWTCPHWHVSSHISMLPFPFSFVSVNLVSVVVVFYRVRELRKAREHENIQKSPLTMWRPSPDFFSCFFSVSTRPFTRGKKKDSSGKSTTQNTELHRTTDFSYYTTPLFHISFFLLSFFYKRKN